MPSSPGTAKTGRAEAQAGAGRADHEGNAPSPSISLSVQIGGGRGVTLHNPDDIRQVPMSFPAAKPPKHTGLYHFTCQGALKGRPSAHTLWVSDQAGLYLREIQVNKGQVPFPPGKVHRRGKKQEDRCAPSQQRVRAYRGRRWSP